MAVVWLRHNSEMCSSGVSSRRDITHLMTGLSYSLDNCITDGGLESCMWLNQFCLLADQSAMADAHSQAFGKVYIQMDSFKKLLLLF